VIIQNAENSYSNVIKPRLAELGADFSRIHSINENTERLSLLSPKIEEVIAHYGAKLFIADPVQGYMNLYNIETVRKTLMHLRGVAERTDCAILLIGHLTKSQTKAQYRGLGS
jgi:predicted ATP-dependent serine protease